LITNFKNLAQSGDSYFHTFIKAKEVLSQNPQVKTIFIEFTNIDVTQFRDEEIWEDRYMNWKYPIYAPIMDVKEHLFLLVKNPISLFKALPKTTKKQFSRIETNHYNFESVTSGYLYIKESKLDSLLLANSHKEPAVKNYFNKSTHNIAYLEKLIALC